MRFLALLPEGIEFTTGLLVALLAIAIVFTVLVLVIFCVKFMYVFFKNKKNIVKEVVNEEAPKAPVVKSTEIKDEDMMVAALIATIDFNNETKEDARLVSIKQIG